VVAKQFYIIAYDISGNRRRQKITKILEEHGVRMNKSVFECFVFPDTFNKLEKDISNIINLKKDSVLYYPICRKCMSKSKATFRKTILSGLVTV
jgi:CRISPR-associated protein Cas2